MRTIEAEEFVAEALQDGEGLLCGKVFKLDQAVGPLVLSSQAELLHHSHVLLPIQAVLLVALGCEMDTQTSDSPCKLVLT